MATSDNISVLYTQLSAIDNMVLAFNDSMSSMTRLSMLRGIESSAQLITLKLQRMHHRWMTFLPFQEAIDVRFCDWVEKADGWIKAIQQEAEVPSSGFVLDLVQNESVGVCFEELKKDVPVYCGKIDKLLAHTYPEWEEKAFGSQITELKAELTQEREKAVSAVAEMRNELNELEQFFHSALQGNQFITLALRLQARDCKKVEKDAKNEVISEHNNWPSKYEKERARVAKDNIKLKLLTDTKLEELKDYVNLDDPQLYDDPCFGQFIFKNRHKLSVGDMQQLVKALAKIGLYNEYVDPKGTQRKRERKAQGRELTEQESDIVARLLDFVKLVEWRSGATQDSITNGINKMLGVGYNLEPDMLLLSDQLWKLLKTRKKCDAAKSFKVTWLNIVGWCLNKGLISGTSPTLCKLFFPRCGQDDYKAIDKGRKEPPVQFQKVNPLLERFLK